MGFEVEGPTNLIFIGSFWFRVSKVEATSIFNIMGGKCPTIFKEFANHEAIRFPKSHKAYKQT